MKYIILARKKINQNLTENATLTFQPTQPTLKIEKYLPRNSQKLTALVRCDRAGVSMILHIIRCAHQPYMTMQTRAFDLKRCSTEQYRMLCLSEVGCRADPHDYITSIRITELQKNMPVKR
jgi:hypothetical protein